MAARVYDIYDLNSAFVQPTAPAPQAIATAQRDATRLLRGFAYLLTYAGIHLMLAFVIAATALPAINADVGVVYVAALLTALVGVVWGGWRA